MVRGIYVTVHIGDGTEKRDKLFEAKWAPGQKLEIVPTEAESDHPELLLSLKVQDEERALAVIWSDQAKPSIDASDTAPSTEPGPTSAAQNEV
jgi:hypothetical protein